MTQAWRPTRFKRVEGRMQSSMRTSLILTDAGKAYIKALGNPEGPERLASELIGLRVARWAGLSVPEVSVLTLDAEDEIPFDDGVPPKAKASPGPAIVTREIPEAYSMGGRADGLQNVSNPSDMARLVVVDTWLCNADRHPPYSADGTLAPSAFTKPNRDNVLLARAAGGGQRLFAIDFGHSLKFKGGLPKARNIDHVQDAAIYGLFPEFRPYVMAGEHLVDAMKRLAAASRAELEPLVADLPPKWEVSAEGRASLLEFLAGRATWLVGSGLTARIQALCATLDAQEEETP